MQPALIILAALVLLLIVLSAALVFFRLFALWFQAKSAGTDISVGSLLGMSCRKVDARAVVESKIMAAQAGLENIPTETLEAHNLAGGDVRRVVRALILARQKSFRLDWNEAAAIDLSGRDVLEHVD